MTDAQRTTVERLRRDFLDIIIRPPHGGYVVVVCLDDRGSDHLCVIDTNGQLDWKS